MDDDIRDRFRGARQERQVPRGYGRPPQRPRPFIPPQPPIPQPQTPRPLPSMQTEESDFEPPLKPMPPTPKKPKKRRGKKRLRIFLVFLILLLLGAGGYALVHKYIKSNVTAGNVRLSSEGPVVAKPKPAGTIRLVATGDNLAFESINNAAKKPDGSYDYLPLMSSLKPYIDKSDIRLCTESTPGGGESLGLGTYPNFNAPLSWSTGFASLGCNVMNLGTDHTNDKGQPAIDAMLKSWDDQKGVLAIAGANRSAEEQSKIRYFTVKGVKFAFLSYTTRTNQPQTNAYGINMYTDALANKQTFEARKAADLVIVSMNWGKENSPDIITDQDRIAKNLAAHDVDIIIGSGPHILQPAQVLSGTKGHQTLVWYSLGNFINSQLPVENLVGGLAIMDIDVGSLQIKDPKILPFYMHYEWTAAQKKAQTSADLQARHGFTLYPLDLAADALAKSQNGTTVEAQTKRVTDIITKFVPIRVIKSTEF